MYISLQNINKKFGDYQASNDISFSLPADCLCAFLGPSGSGKTTILRMIAGLESPDSGDIFIDNKRVNDIAPAKREIGFVFQNYALFRYMTVFENIAFGMQIKKIPSTKIKHRVEDLLTLTGLENYKDRYPAQLSGGQKQRVAFARAIAPEPKVLLLDEPFAAIDARIRKQLRQWLKTTIKKLHITSIFVTHDQDEASEVADEILIINKGHVEQSGPPTTVYQKPATPFVAQFLGETMRIDNYAVFRGFHLEEGFTEALIRPEFIMVFKSTEEYSYTAEEAIVESFTFRGSYSEVIINLHQISLKIIWPIDRQLLHPQEKVGVLIKKLYLINHRDIKEAYNETLTADNSVII